MKSCSSRRRDIALLAAGAIDSAAGGPLREHLRECAGCRQYWEEMSRACAVLEVAPDSLPQAQNPDAFHQRLVARIQKEPSRQTRGDRDASGVYRGLASLYQGLFSSPWKWALSGAATILLLLAITQWRGSPVNSKPPSSVASLPRWASIADNPPTLLAYQRAAGRSVEALDALLANDAIKTAGPGKLVTASARSQRELSD